MEEFEPPPLKDEPEAERYTDTTKNLDTETFQELRDKLIKIEDDAGDIKALLIEEFQRLRDELVKIGLDTGAGNIPLAKKFQELYSKLIKEGFNAQHEINKIAVSLPALPKAVEIDIEMKDGHIIIKSYFCLANQVKLAPLLELCGNDEFSCIVGLVSRKEMRFTVRKKINASLFSSDQAMDITQQTFSDIKRVNDLLSK